MSIFKEDISNEILYDFLKIHCTIENNFYVLDKLVYRFLNTSINAPNFL